MICSLQNISDDLRWSQITLDPGAVHAMSRRRIEWITSANGATVIAH
jgi:hypothetical protein